MEKLVSCRQRSILKHLPIQSCMCLPGQFRDTCLGTLASLTETQFVIHAAQFCPNRAIVMHSTKGLGISRLVLCVFNITIPCTEIKMFTLY